MRRWLREMLILGLFCGAMSGCGEPRYGYYGDPGYGYSPYSYGWPIYARGYSPVFTYHHSWEDHHLGEGHHDTFWRGSPAGTRFGGGRPSGFGGGGHMGGFAGGHGGGHR